MSIFNSLKLFFSDGGKSILFLSTIFPFLKINYGRNLSLTICIAFVCGCGGGGGAGPVLCGGGGGLLGGGGGG